MDALSSPIEREQEFFKFCICEYLKYGSVDEVFKRHNYNLPISYPGFHRLVKNWGIVKNVGPNTTMGEVLNFLDILSQEKIPLERLYRKLPASFQTSMSTLHRVLQHIKEGTVRRVGTAVILSPESNRNLMLVAKDKHPRVRVSSIEGEYSLPMGFSKLTEGVASSILRVLQQEVFSLDTVEKRLPDIIPSQPDFFMYLDIADVRVQVVNLILSDEILGKHNFSSFKLTDHSFVPYQEIISAPKSIYRSGILEIAQGYSKLLQGEMQVDPLFATAGVNQDLALALDY